VKNLSLRFFATVQIRSFAIAQDDNESFRGYSVIWVDNIITFPVPFSLWQRRKQRYHNVVQDHYNTMLNRFPHFFVQAAEQGAVLLLGI